MCLTNTAAFALDEAKDWTENAFRSSCRGQSFTLYGGSSTPVVTFSANQGPRRKPDGGSSVAGANEEGAVEVRKSRAVAGW